jgi:hypothetical protein
MLKHGEHDDGESARERNPRLAHRRSPGDIERPAFERETAAVAGRHHVGGFVERRATLPVGAFGDLATILDFTALITTQDQAQMGTHIAGTSEEIGSSIAATLWRLSAAHFVPA